MTIRLPILPPKEASIVELLRLVALNRTMLFAIGTDPWLQLSAIDQLPEPVQMSTEKDKRGYVFPAAIQELLKSHGLVPVYTDWFEL